MLNGLYSVPLVVLSVFIAIAASHVALDLASRTSATSGFARRVWLSAGAIAMGSGVWAMHYVGMLAFQLPIEVSYHWPTVALSFLAAVISSAFALYSISRSIVSIWTFIWGGTAMGLGIFSMHFVGMAAMRVAAHGTFSGARVLISLCIAITVSIIALLLAFQLRRETQSFTWRKIASATLMGFAIASMHYCGMSAVSFHATSIAPDTTNTIGVSTLGIAGIVSVALSILALSVIAAILDRRFTSQNEAMLAAARRHQQQVERSLAGVFSGTLDGRITNCNEACARMLGYTNKQALLHSNARQLQTDAESNSFLDALRTSDFVTDFECWLVRFDGSKAFVLANANRVYGQHGDIVEGTMIDITARRTAEDELRASEQKLRAEILERQRMEVAMHLNQRMEAVGQLAAGIAHEINTPVQYVSDSVHFIRDSLVDLQAVIAALREVEQAVLSEQPAQELARKAGEIANVTDLVYLLENAPLAAQRSLDGLERIATIVRSMKAFAHPDNLDKSYVDLNKAILTTLDVARNEIKYVADVHTDLGEIASLHCYAGQINQVLLNLVVNAAHAIADRNADTRERGNITIQTRESGSELLLTISDSGCGIPDEIKGRIFDPFFTTKEVGRGTGQGLAIVRNIVVDKHSGSIDVTSERGVGTTFVIHLPREMRLAA